MALLLVLFAAGLTAPRSAALGARARAPLVAPRAAPAMAVIDPELAELARAQTLAALKATSAAIQSMPTVDLALPEVAQGALDLGMRTLETLAASPEAAFGVGFASALLALLIVAKPALEGAPYVSGASAYTPQKAERFYGKRAPLVAARLLRLAALTSAFNVKLLLDWRFGWLEQNEKERAKEALVLCTQLGPTFIKLGQALSIRTDLIPEAYALELRALQDAVPPFDSDRARQIMRSELNVADLSSVFAKLSERPLASASIGQVYKGTLKDGREVAVKVQRPNILSEIALDLFILRLLAPLQVRVSNLFGGRKTYPKDIELATALVDEWGRGFVAETDYIFEAQNTETFVKAMQNRGLDAVTAPTVVRALSSRKVLVTEWVEGTRLDKDKSPDVPRLCAVAINAYLTMLLDTGVLHCDPHPGNLLRTLDGRLCILDWGMTLPVPSDLQYSLIEFIAHVNAEDLEQIPQDFVNLGFTPANKLEQVKSSGMTEGVSFVLRQLGKGGGPKKMGENVLQELKERYGDDLTTEELRDKARAEMRTKMEVRTRRLQGEPAPRPPARADHRARPYSPAPCISGATGRGGRERAGRDQRGRGDEPAQPRALPGAALHPLCEPRVCHARGDRADRLRGLLHRQAGLPLPEQAAAHRQLAARQGGAPLDDLRQQRGARTHCHAGAAGAGQGERARLRLRQAHLAERLAARARQAPRDERRLLLLHGEHGRRGRRRGRA